MINKEISIRASEKELVKRKSIDAIKRVETDNIISMELDIEHRDDECYCLTVTIEYI